MSENIKSILLSIHNRIAPKIKINRLSAKVDVSSIDISSDDESLRVSLSLCSPIKNKDNEDIKKYRWEYMDCNTGALYESELDYNSTDEEVIAFFQHTLATDKFTQWRG